MDNIPDIFSYSNTDDIRKYFIEACKIGDLESIYKAIELNVLQFTNDAILNLCIHDLIEKKENLIIRRLIPTYIGFDRIKLGTPDSPIQQHSYIYLLKITIRRFIKEYNHNYDKTLELLKFSPNYKHDVQKYLIKIVYDNIVNNEPKSDDEILKLWNFIYLCYNNIIIDKKSPVENLDITNPLINEFPDIFKTELLRRLLFDIQFNHNNCMHDIYILKLQKFITHPSMKNHLNFILKGLMLILYQRKDDNLLNIIFLTIEKGGDLNNVIDNYNVLDNYEHYDNVLNQGRKQCMIKFRDTYYPLPDVKVAE